jgi:RNA polymerase sigma factor (sigma-70 family)
MPPTMLAGTAWEAALPLQRSRLVRYCFLRTGNVDVAEDLAQETLYEAWRHLHKLHEPAGLERWLGAIARNVCRRWARERGNELAHRPPFASITADEASPWEEAVADDFDLEIELERTELVALLDRAMALLPPDTRRVLVQRYVQEAPQAEIARQLGVTEGAIEARVQRGKLALQRILTARFPDDAAAYGLVAAGDDAWQGTRLWCPGCGRRHLEGVLKPEQGELRLRCPDCSVRGHGYHINARMGVALLRSARTYKPAVTRVLNSIYELFQVYAVDGAVRCSRCQGWMPIRVEERADASPQWEWRQCFSVSCPRCGRADGIDDHESWHSLTWSLPETRRFWREHPRMRFLPARQIEADGSPAAVTGFESLTDGRRLEVVALRATGKVLRVDGLPPVESREE